MANSRPAAFADSWRSANFSASTRFSLYSSPGAAEVSQSFQNPLLKSLCRPYTGSRARKRGVGESPTVQ